MQDTGAAADAISLTNAGTIDINFGSDEVVSGPGDVTVTANGATSNVLTGGDNGFNDGGAIHAGGVATVHADQDVLIGDTGSAMYGDVQGVGGVTVTAGRDVIIDENSFIFSMGGGAVSVTAGATSRSCMT